MVFFTNGGAEATERDPHGPAAHRPAQVLTTYRSYHGATGGAIRLTVTPAAGRASRACRVS